MGEQYHKQRPDPGWRALAVAILERSWLDAHSTSQEQRSCETGLPAGVTVADDARRFLAGGGARVLFEIMELDTALLDDIEARLPRSEYMQLSLWP